jgi:cation transport ATPase
VDESNVTGESYPMNKGVDDKVTGGTINATGMVLMRATRVGADTSLAQVKP